MMMMVKSDEHRATVYLASLASRGKNSQTSLKDYFLMVHPVNRPLLYYV